MSQAADDLNTSSVVVALRFAATSDQLPIALVKEAGSGPDTHKIEMADHDVVIQDARPLTDELDLDRQGFDFMRYPTSVQDFYDDDEVQRVYYPEMESLIKSVTGASKVVVFDHTIRVDGRRQAGAPQGAGRPSTESTTTSPRGLPPSGCATCCHPTRLRHDSEKRYASINVWRPIVSPVETKPLVICGYTGIADADLVTSERHYPRRQDRWHLLSGAQSESAVVLLSPIWNVKRSWC